MRAESPCNIDARLRLGESHDLRSPGPVTRQGLRLASGNIQPKRRCAGLPRFPSRPGEGLRGVAITYAPEINLGDRSTEPVAGRSSSPGVCAVT
jgi:hypothetical protein